MIEETAQLTVLGMVEYASIADGIRGGDAMVKAAPAELIEARPITPGRFIVMVAGDVASVEASVKAGVASAAPEGIIESFVIANLHEQILPALKGGITAPTRDAVGVLETSNSAAMILSVDAALKAAGVTLVSLHLALHIGGKGYAALVGDVADIEASVEAGVAAAGASLVSRTIIPNPYPEMYERLLRKPSW